MELVLQDVALTREYIQDKMTRKATHCLMRAVVMQMEWLFSKPISRGFLGEDVRVHALTDRDQKRVRLSNGTLCLVNERTGEVVPIFPLAFDLRELLLVNHTVGRGSTGSALMTFAQHIGLLWTATWGVYHDTWNSIKKAANKSRGGEIWKSIVRFASVCNINFGPFRSGSWFFAKRQTWTDYVDSHSSLDESFREAARHQAELEGKAIVTEADYSAWWLFFCKLRSCVEVGPVLKFARWMSIEQCWDFYRKEIWFTKEVLKAMNPELCLQEVQKSTTAMLDVEAATQMTTSKTGLLVRAPSYITQGLVDDMEMFNIATASARDMYKFRTTKVKTPQDHLEHTLRLVKGDWEIEFVEMINNSFFKVTNSSRFGALGSDARSEQNPIDMVSYVLHLLTEQISRLLPELLQYPHCSVKVLDPDAAIARAARDECLHHLQVILASEAKVLQGDLDEKLVLDDIYWKDNTTVRLFLNIVDKEAGAADVGPGTLHVAKAINVKWPDEKGSEDVHQHVRDIQRHKRHKRIRAAAIYDAQIQSGVIESRGIPSPQVSLHEVANKSWFALSQKSKDQQSFSVAPTDWPAKLNTILHDNRSWPSPTVPGHMESFVAWRWLLAKTGALLAAGHHASASWWSRLAHLHHCISHVASNTHYISLCACNWGCIVAKLSVAAPSHWVFQNNSGAFDVVHFTSIDGWTVAPVRGKTRDSVVGLYQTGAAQGLLEFALRDRREFTKWELQKAIISMETPTPTLADVQQNAPTLLKRLVKLVFDGDDEMANRILDAYSKQKVEVPVDVDEEMADLLEEMAISDQVNTGELKTWKNDLQKKAVRKLAVLRADERNAAAAKRAAQKKRAKLKVAKKLIKGHKIFKVAKKPKSTLASSSTTPTPASAPAVDVVAVVPVVAVPPEAGAAAPCPPPPDAIVLAPPGPDHAAPPKLHGDWRLLQVDGGWFRYSPSARRLDAHCRAHGASCKMDRSLRKGPIGLACLWLVSKAGNKIEHDRLKYTLSQADKHIDRERARASFQALAATNLGDYKAIVDLELDLRGTRDEPLALACPMTALGP